MSIQRDRVLVLKRYPYGESSLVVHAASRAHGRVHLIAKGAYRPTSRYYAILDYFDTLEIEWDQNPRRELSILRAGTVQRRRRTISSELERYRCGQAILELGDLSVRPEQADARLYDLVENALERLELASDPADLTLVVFELEFLQNLGLAPALERCAACAGPADPVSRDPLRVAFSAGAGGRLCRACALEARAGGRRVGTLPLEVLDDGRELLLEGSGRADERPNRRRTAGERAGGERARGLAQQRLDRVRDFVERFLDYHLETRPLTQRRFLAVANRNAPAHATEAF